MLFQLTTLQLLTLNAMLVSNLEVEVRWFRVELGPFYTKICLNQATLRSAFQVQPHLSPDQSTPDFSVWFPVRRFVVAPLTLCLENARSSSTRGSTLVCCKSPRDYVAVSSLDIGNNLCIRESNWKIIHLLIHSGIITLVS